MRRILPWFLLLLAIAAWALFVLLVMQLSQAREEYATHAAQLQQNAILGESASRLHALVTDTEAPRAALDHLTQVSVLQAAQVIEETGRKAGASVSIGDATPAGSSPQGLSAFSMLANGSGSYAGMMRTLSLFETLPIPGALQQFELEKQGSTWQFTVHLNVLVSSTQ